jgi:ATP-binding cassette subfamily C protein
VSGPPAKSAAEGLELWDNQPLWLDDAGTAWRLESGALGVFATTRETAAGASTEDGGARSVTGARHFLFAVAPGAIVPPMPAPAGEWQLLALALEESRIRPLPYPPPEPDEELERAIQNWLECLGHVAGGPDFVTRPEESAVQALARLRAAFYEAWAQVAARKEEADRQRFEERRRVDEALASRALEHLADAAASGARERIPLEGSHLLVALRAIGRAQGIAVRPAMDDGSRHTQLSAIAQRSGFRTRMVVLSGIWWESENGPLLAFLKEDSRSVALLPAQPGRWGGPRYELFDPADGSRRRVDAESAFALEPRGYVLYRAFPRDRRTASLIRFALHNNWHDLRTIALAGVAAMALGLVAPQATAVLIDQAIPDADRSMVWQLGLAMLASAVGAMLFLLTQSVATLRVQSALYTELQAGVWDFLLKLRPAFFRRHTAGELSARAYALTRIVSDAGSDVLLQREAGLHRARERCGGRGLDDTAHAAAGAAAVPGAGGGRAAVGRGAAVDQRGVEAAGGRLGAARVCLLGAGVRPQAVAESAGAGVEGPDPAGEPDGAGAGAGLLVPLHAGAGGQSAAAVGHVPGLHRRADHLPDQPDAGRRRALGPGAGAHAVDPHAHDSRRDARGGRD